MSEVKQVSVKDFKTMTKRIQGFQPKDDGTPHNRLFVYGIFLGQGMRNAYRMSEERYAVVKDYVTTIKGGSIVEAQKGPEGVGLGLTGLIVEVDPVTLEGRDNWAHLDALEHGYKRTVIKTIKGETAYMYVKPERGQDGR